MFRMTPFVFKNAYVPMKKALPTVSHVVRLSWFLLECSV